MLTTRHRTARDRTASLALSTILLLASGQAYGGSDDPNLWVFGGVELNTPPSFGSFHHPSGEVGLFYQQNTGTQFTLHAADFVDRQHGWAAGDAGRVTRTNDGGASWSAAIVGEGVSYRGVSFIDRLNGYIVGTNGTVRSTRDGGLSWTRLDLGLEQTVHGVSSVSTDRTWIVGEGFIGSTFDGGSSWSIQPYEGDEAFLGVSFVNSFVGWVVGEDGLILRTEDAGQTWERITTSTNADLLAVDFSDTERGVAVGDRGTVLLSSNGGLSWTERIVGGVGTIRDVEIATPTTTWAVADGGLFVSTHDGGASWVVGGGLTDQNFYAVATARPESRTTSWLAGAGGTLQQSFDEGLRWSRQNSGTLFPIRDVQFLNEDEGWFVADGGRVGRTSNGGQSWRAQSLAEAGIVEDLRSVSFGDSRHGWAVGENHRVIRTTDGGTTWVEAGFGRRLAETSAVFFVDRDHGWIVGQGNPLDPVWLLLRTTDGGESWQESEIGLEQIRDLQFVNSQRGWMCGRFGGPQAIARTVDGGASWQVTSVPVPSTLTRLSFVDESLGWAVGTNGKVLKTVDGGVSWQDISFGAAVALNDVKFISRSEGWVVGDRGAVYYSADGGATWTVRDSGTVENLYAVEALGGNSNEPGERWVVRVSVKWILDDSGQRARSGRYATDAQIRRAITEANTILALNGASWSLSLSEIEEVRGASQFHEMHPDDRVPLENAAKSDPARYSWRDDAINFYVVELERGGGVCSFPRAFTGHSNDIILINNQGILNGGGGWLHEIGHYLSLFHTFQNLDGDSSRFVCQGQGAAHADPRGFVPCPDVCPHDTNVMSYEGVGIADLVFSECQMTEMEWELFNPAGSRGHVLERQTIDVGSTTEASDSISFLRGDSNFDSRVDISDATATLNVLFLGGDPTKCADAADANDDGRIDLSDAVATLSQLFLGANAIASPGPTVCSPDGTPDDLAECLGGTDCPESDQPGHDPGL